MKKRLAPILVCAVFLLAACNLPTGPTPTPAGLSSTIAAQTLQVMMTQVVEKATPVPPLATVTPRQPTSVPTNTQPAPTKAPPPTEAPTEIPTPCDAAAFISDVTVPDGSTFTAGAKFVKTWRLKNIGTCTWTTNYAVVFAEGNAMSTEAATNLSASVAPGATIDISLNLTAPTAIGSHKGSWRLRNAAGVVFGTGASGKGTFFVDIKVAAPTSINGSYSFIDNICAADWSNGSSLLTCSVKDGNAGGFALRVEKPNLENGSTDDEPALLTVPEQVNDGVIHGKYPSIALKAGDTFRAIVGCEYKASDCKVRFQLDYQIDAGAIQTFAYWDETYDDTFHSVTADLSSLAGKNVRLILTVQASGSAKGDRALWLMPRITRTTP